MHIQGGPAGSAAGRSARRVGIVEKRNTEFGIRYRARLDAGAHAGLQSDAFEDRDAALAWASTQFLA